MSEDGGDEVAEQKGATLDDWKLLDVMPGVPARLLRTAYARKLKTTKPETDPAGFQRLRAAYERALASLAEDAPRADAAPDAVDQQALADLMHRFESRRRRGDMAGALAPVDEALSGSFRAAWRNAVEDALFDSIAEDPSTRLRLVRALSTRFDWGEASGRQTKRQAALGAGKINAVRERAEAADLVATFRARAAAARTGAGPAGDRILARILGPYRVGLYDRELGDTEREVAIEFMSVYHRLAGVDGFVDPRMLAAVRAAVGAAPWASPPPAPQPAAPQRPAAASAPPRRKRYLNWRYVYFAAVALLFAGRAFQGEFGKSDPDAATYTSSVGRPDIPNTLDVSWKGDKGLLNLGPLLRERFVDTISAVRVKYADASRDIPLADLRQNAVVTIPSGMNELFLRLVFRDGTLGANKDFEVDNPKPDTAGAPDERPASPQVPKAAEPDRTR